jgi:hypothetical protein
MCVCALGFNPYRKEDRVLGSLASLCESLDQHLNQLTRFYEIFCGCLLQFIRMLYFQIYYTRCTLDNNMVDIRILEAKAMQVFLISES